MTGTWTLDCGTRPEHWRLDPSDPRAVLAFTTRNGGVGRPPFDTLNLGRSTTDNPDAVDENRRRILLALDLDPGHLATAGQIHGHAIAEVTGPGLHPDVDGLVTRVPGLALAVTSADCLPLLYVARGAVAAVHAGWRGLAAGIPTAGLAAVAERSGQGPGEVAIHFGPCIGSCCYRVGPEVAERFPEASLARDDDGWRLDLVAAARIQLVAAGVRPEAMADAPGCTSCEPERYFSHRRDAGRTGRHWAVAALRAS